jgi:hypothetical protein
MGTRRYSEDRIRRWLLGLEIFRGGVTQWLCHDCGSLVQDRAVHDEWHSSQPPLAEDERFKDADMIGRSLEVWKIVITVQQHFNDIEMRIRNFALTLLVAVLGASAIAFRERRTISILDFQTSLAAVFLVGGTITWLAFYFVDQIWYHRLLVGAVGQGMKLEELLADHVPGIGLTQAIGEASPIRLPGGLTLHSRHKMLIFYFVIAVILLVLATLGHLDAAIDR